MASNNLKLIYFDFRARAEVIRLLLAAGGQEYEDVRITESEWAHEKSKMPFGQMPVLQIGNTKYAQSVAIVTYLARELGFYGKTNLDGLMIDQVVQLNEEFRAKCILVLKENNPLRTAKLKQSMKEVEVPRYFHCLEKLLKENNTGYFFGSSLSLADISTYDNIFAFSVRGPLLTLPNEEYPTLKAHYAMVENSDRINHYLASRKPADC